MDINSLKAAVCQCFRWTFHDYFNTDFNHSILHAKISKCLIVNWFCMNSPWLLVFQNATKIFRQLSRKRKMVLNNTCTTLGCDNSCIFIQCFTKQWKHCIQHSFSQFSHIFFHLLYFIWCSALCSQVFDSVDESILIR